MIDLDKARKHNLKVLKQEKAFFEELEQQVHKNYFVFKTLNKKQKQAFLRVAQDTITLMMEALKEDKHEDFSALREEYQILINEEYPIIFDRAQERCFLVPKFVFGLGFCSFLIVTMLVLFILVDLLLG